MANGGISYADLKADLENNPRKAEIDAVNKLCGNITLEGGPWTQEEVDKLKEQYKTVHVDLVEVK